MLELFNDIENFQLDFFNQKSKIYIGRRQIGKTFKILQDIYKSIKFKERIVVVAENNSLNLIKHEIQKRYSSSQLVDILSNIHFISYYIFNNSQPCRGYKNISKLYIDDLNMMSFNKDNFKSNINYLCWNNSSLAVICSYNSADITMNNLNEVVFANENTELINNNIKYFYNSIGIKNFIIYNLNKSCCELYYGSTE